MTPRTVEHAPIFIGGTGRSGTSVMARMLNSHPDIVLPTHENKLIVEAGGLRDIVEQLSGRFDMKRRHYAVANFALWAGKLRTLGFRDPALNGQARSLMNDQGMGLHAACEAVARRGPAADLSIHAIAPGFGLEHYDACVGDFLRRIGGTVIEDGIVDTEGLIRPFMIPDLMDRGAVLEACRTFLSRLYSAPLARAGARRWCDDTPSNWLYLDFLHELYPDMRFIHMIRDPRDVVGSYLKQVWAPPDPQVIVGMFKAQFADYAKVKASLPPSRVKEIRLEDLTENKTGALVEIADFLGVEGGFNGDIFANDRTNSGSYAGGLGAEATRLIETELGDWMETHGYAG